IRSRFFANFPELKDVGFDRMFPSNAMRTWKLNNLVFAILIGAILMAYEFVHYAYCILPAWTNQEKQLLLLWFGGVAAFANCLVDLKLTWRFYNPKFG